jgi:hypothetical protein
MWGIWIHACQVFSTAGMWNIAIMLDCTEPHRELILGAQWHERHVGFRVNKVNVSSTSLFRSIYQYNIQNLSYEIKLMSHSNKALKVYDAVPALTVVQSCGHRHNSTCHAVICEPLQHYVGLFWQGELNFCFPFRSCFLYNTKCKQAGCSVYHLLSRRFLARLILRPWRWRRHVPPKRRLTSNMTLYPRR